MDLLSLINKYIGSSLKQNNISNSKTIISYYKETIISDLETSLCELHESIKCILSNLEQPALTFYKTELESQITSTQAKIEETNNAKNKFELAYFLDFYQYFLREIENSLTSAKTV